jgi:hypothetical protein
LVVALSVAALAGAVAWHIGNYPSDFDHILMASRIFLRGDDPYAAIGPGRAIPWPWPMYYPAPALLVLSPFLMLPGAWAHTAFTTISAGLLAYLFARDTPWRLLFFLSGAFFFTVTLGQWGMWLALAALMPRTFGVIYAAKPTMGAVSWARLLDWRALVAPAALTLLSVLMQPAWPARWLAVVSGGYHPSMVALPGGFLLLAAVLRWRQPDARLLLALSLVPQTISPYELVLPFLIARTKWECAYLAVATSMTVVLAFLSTTPAPPISLTTGGDAYMQATTRVLAPLFLVLVYLPCLWMVFRRREVVSDVSESTGPGRAQALG